MHSIVDTLHFDWNMALVNWKFLLFFSQVNRTTILCVYGPTYPLLIAVLLVEKSAKIFHVNQSTWSTVTNISILFSHFRHLCKWWCFSFFIVSTRLFQKTWHWRCITFLRISYFELSLWSMFRLLMSYKIIRCLIYLYTFWFHQSLLLVGRCESTW